MKSTLSFLHPGLEPATSKAGSKAKGDPAKTSAQQAGGLAPRLQQNSALRGRRLALLDNTKVNAQELLQAISKRLAPYGISEVRMWRKRHAGETGAALFPEIMDWKPDLVLTGLGD